MPQDTPIQQGPTNPTHGKTIGVLGAGVMGQTFLDALQKHLGVSPQQLWAACKSDTTGEKLAKRFPDVAVYHQPAAFPLNSTDVLLVCVKPYQLDSLLTELTQAGLNPNTLVISIVAGKPLSILASNLPDTTPIIRAMPNTPAVVGQAMTAICPGYRATQADIHLAEALFGAVGTCIPVAEHHFDAVTGLGGSGPAYLYLIMEALADGGVRVGLPRQVATQIVAQTVLGAATMVLNSGRHPAALRDDVTTPAGCTIAGLLTLEDGKIRSVLARAVEEAAETAKDLG